MHFKTCHEHDQPRIRIISRLPQNTVLNTAVVMLVSTGCSCLSVDLDTRGFPDIVYDHIWCTLLLFLLSCQVFCPVSKITVSLFFSRTKKHTLILCLLHFFPLMENVSHFDWQPLSCDCVLSQGNRTLTKKEKRSLTEYSDYVQDVVKAKKVRFHCNNSHSAIRSKKLCIQVCRFRYISEAWNALLGTYHLYSILNLFQQGKLYEEYLAQCAAEYDFW